MLHVTMLILKTIGIILGVLLLLLLFLLLATLFVPVRYKAEFEKNDETMKGVFTLSWLLHLLHVSVAYHGTLKYTVRILGFKLIDSSKPKKKKRIKKTKSSENQKIDIKEAKESETKDSETKDINKSKKSDSQIKDIKNSKDSENQTEDIKKAKESENEAEDIKSIKESENKTENFRKEQDIQEDIVNIKSKETENNKVKKLILNISCKIKGINQKIKDMMNSIKEIVLKINEGKLKLSKLKEVLFTDINKRGYKKIWKSFKKIVKHIKPRKIKGTFLFGSDDPYVTGQVFTYFGMFYAWIGKNFNLLADFNEEKLEGKIKVKGFMQMGYLLWVLVRLYFNKDFKEVLRTLRNIKEV